MKTPITDAAWNATAATHVQRANNVKDTARRLETDRAALMEVCTRLAELDLNGTDESLVRFIVLAHQNSAKTALAAAKANFPQP